MAKQTLRVFWKPIGAAAFSLAIVASPAASAEEPWRRSDAVLVQACFDRLSGEPPQTILVDQIEDGATAGYHLKLVGFTTTQRPIYQGAIGHPSRLTAMLFHLPGSDSSVVVKRPADLPKSIDLWRDINAQQCTNDDHAQFKLLRGQDPSDLSECPDLGLKLSMKVAASSENSLRFVQLAQRGVIEFNNLRGCSEFIHK